MSSRILVVIVNYRTADLVVDCLRSLVGEVEADPSLRVVVCDNASGDDSVLRIESAISDNGWGAWCQLMPLEKNLGFSAGNNAAIGLDLQSSAPADFYLLLNPDTVVRPGAIAALREFLLNHPNAGIAGSRLEDPDGTPQIAAFRFPGIVNEFERHFGLGFLSKLLSRWIIAPSVQQTAHEADWIAGASMLVRRVVFEKIGLLDEGYFLYFDEVDFCVRARRAGFENWYVPQSRVIHLVGQSTQFSDSRRKAGRRPAYWFESRRRFFLKNYSPSKAVLADIAAVTGYALGLIHRSARGKACNDPPFFLRDLIRHSVLFRGFRQ